MNVSESHKGEASKPQTYSFMLHIQTKKIRMSKEIILEITVHDSLPQFGLQSIGELNNGGFQLFQQLNAKVLLPGNASQDFYYLDLVNEIVFDKQLRTKFNERMQRINPFQSATRISMQIIHPSPSEGTNEYDEIRYNFGSGTSKYKFRLQFRPVISLELFICKINFALTAIGQC